jgi:hypothetical protein
VHAWDESELGLISKTRQIEAAINKVDDAQYYLDNKGFVVGDHEKPVVSHHEERSWLADVQRLHGYFF